MANESDMGYFDGGGLLGGSGGGWLGNLLNFSGGRSTTADLYGDLFTKKQLAAIQQRESDAKFAGLLGAINQFAAPSEFKKGWGQLLGTAGQAMLGAEGGDKAATTALGGQLTAQKIAQLRQEMLASQQYQQTIQQLRDARLRAIGGAGAPAPAPPPGAPPGAPPPGPTPDAPVPNPAGNGPPPPQGTFGLPGSAPRPQPSWGLPPALPPDAQHTGLDPNQQFAGLLGGGTQLPPTEEAGLPPPDTVIPSGPGGLLNPDAVRTVGAGADDQWLAQNAPFPTRADPQGDPVKWQHNRPVIDPNDPASRGPGSPAGGGPGPGPRPAGGGLLTGSAWEIANNNFGGMRIPGVNKTPSQGGFQSFATPEAGLRAISRQLDRYASGATTGKKLTTIREIVSTWAPPSENPTATLIARAAKIIGTDPDQPLDLSDPLTKAKLITATIANEQGGRVPVDPELIASVASAPPDGLDEVVGQRRGVPGFTRAQYSGGGAAAPVPGAPPGVGGDQIIPGLGMSPQDLAILNLFSAGAGKGTPFNSLLDTYYKDPTYLEQAAGAGARGRIAEEEPMQKRMKLLDLMIDMRKNGIIFDPKTNTVSTDPTYDAVIGRREEDKQATILDYQKKLKTFDESITIEQEKRGETREIDKEGRQQKPATVVGPEGRMIDTTLPQAEIDRRRREQSMRPGQYRPDDIVDKPTAGLSADMEYRVTPQGTFEPAPIPNTPAARKEAEAIEAKRVADAAKQTSADFIVQDIDEIRRKVFENPNTTTGVVGGVLSKVDETAAGEIRNLVEGIEAGVLIDRLGALKAGSSTGASGFGGLTGPEGDKLTRAWGSLKQTQGTAQFMRALDRYERVYLEILHGPVVAQKVIAEKAAGAAARKDATSGKPIDRATYDKLPRGSVYTAPDGSMRTKP